jgi:hypothetical protein
MYKNAAARENNLTMLLAHFNQIYNTLGCVLQDLEFQIGRTLASPQPQPSRDILPEQEQQYHPYQKGSRQKSREQ